MFNNHISNKPYLPQTGTHKKRSGDMEKINLEHISRLGFPKKLTPGQATLPDIYIHMILRQRLSRNTAKKYITTLERINKHPIPVNIQQPTENDWINHSDYREQIENSTTALQNEWKAIKKLLTAYGIQHWDYQPPSTTTQHIRTLQHPNRVRNMIHHKYTNNKDKNLHLQYLILTTYMIGARNPSEPPKITLDDVNLENGTIIITEPKKHNKKRMIKPNKHFMTGRNCKSMKYWIDNIRPRYTSKYTNNKLFITLTGRPFTKNYLRKYLNKNIKPHYPEYQTYTCRHWAATAQLIKEYIETKNWNESRVSRWLGHDNTKTTKDYINQAEMWLEIAPYDWFERVLKRSEKHNRKFQKGEKHVWTTESLLLEGYGPAGIYTLITGVKQSSTPQEIMFEESQSFFFLFFVGVAA
jgi:site-specific recombinase XerD